MEDSLRLMREDSAIQLQRLERIQGSLGRVGEQQAVEAVRRDDRNLDIVGLQWRWHECNKLNLECRENIAAMRREVVQQQASLQPIHRVRSTMRSNIVNGVANGAVTSIMTAAGTAGELSFPAILI